MSDAAVAAALAPALELQASGRATDAAAILGRAAAARPDSAEIANHLGNALQDAGRQDAALDAYRRAGAADPGLTPPRQKRRYLVITHGRPPQGIEENAEAPRAPPAHRKR